MSWRHTTGSAKRATSVPEGGGTGDPWCGCGRGRATITSVTNRPHQLRTLVIGDDPAPLTAGVAFDGDRPDPGEQTPHRNRVLGSDHLVAMSPHPGSA